LLPDSEIHKKIRTRYAFEIESLEKLGFRELCFFAEQLPAFSAILWLPMALLMRSKGELIHVSRPLRLEGWYALLAEEGTGTFALPMALGIKFYTRFTDGGGIVSTSFPSQAVPKPETGLLKFAAPRSLEETWTFHRDSLKRLEAEGRQADLRMSLENFSEISRKEDDIQTT
jgi:hypothetical protein